MTNSVFMKEYYDPNQTDEGRYALLVEQLKKCFVRPSDLVQLYEATQSDDQAMISNKFLSLNRSGVLYFFDLEVARGFHGPVFEYLAPLKPYLAELKKRLPPTEVL